MNQKLMITIAARQIECIRINSPEIEHLDPDLMGTSRAAKQIIYFDGTSDPFNTLIHEVAHVYNYFTGQRHFSRSDEETSEWCGCFVSQLMIENGPHIFEDLLIFAKTGVLPKWNEE